ncbi:hypothetical protein IJ541_10805 [bacterium]|nr:hypothetical protein [bacterium]
MKQAAGLKVVNKKPTDKLTLILLSPKQQEKVTQEDVKNFYKNLTSILMSEN